MDSNFKLIVCSPIHYFPRENAYYGSISTLCFQDIWGDYLLFLESFISMLYYVYRNVAIWLLWTYLITY